MLLLSQLLASLSMKAYTYDKASKPSGMAFLTTFQHKVNIQDTPLKKGQLLVEVKAVSINPVDYKKVGLGLIFGDMDRKPACQDLSAVVLKTAAGSAYSVGDEVFGKGVVEYGVLVEKTIVLESNITKKPATLSFAEAAALPTVAVTGLQAIQGQALKKGDTCVVVGASGGCGLVGVQIARGLVGKEGKVYGICSARNIAAVDSLGVCDAVLDYTKPESITGPESILRRSKIDVIYDTVSSAEKYDSLNGQSYQDALAFTGARIAAINGGGGAFVSYFIGLQWLTNLVSDRYKLTFANINSAAMASVAELVERKEVKPVIDQVFDMTAEGCAAAFDRVRSRRAVGKVVVNVA